MNETLLNLLQEKRRRKENTISYGCQLRNTSGGAAAKSIALMQQFG